MAQLSYRRARREEAELAADLMSAAFELEPEDPVLVAFRWDHPKQGWSHGREFALLDGAPVAFLEWQHGHWSRLPERHCWIEVWLDRAHMDEQLLVVLWERIAGEAVRDGARTLNAAAGEAEHEMLRVLDALGYARERTTKMWELDLGAQGARILAEAAAARARLEPAGIRLLTLAEWNAPDRFEQLHALNELTRRDIPHTAPILEQTLDDFMTRVKAPSMRQDRWWVALDGGKAIAMSYLHFPPVRGNVWTAYTCSHPDYRGRGIARAVKLQSLGQAVELGVPAVRTDNDSENSAMLHINETLGYQRLPGFVSFVKRLPPRALR